jgi:monoamine oxidase
VDADVVVVGAGAAGLAAARRLAGHSLRVIVLEARERAGGRAWSRQMTRTVLPAELGAEFIHGPAQETLALLREAGLASIDTGGDSWVSDETGDLQPNDDEFSSAASIFERACSTSEDESVEHFLQRFERDDALRNIARQARTFVEGFDAADPAIASARSIAEEWRSGVDSSTARPLGGYAPMFDHLRAACERAGVHIQFSTIVRRISWPRGTVAVEVKSHGVQARTIRARAAIVTLPAGVLRHRGDETEVIFDPELPAAKTDALRSIEMGHAVKVILCFRSAFWERIRDGRYRDAAFFRGEGPCSAYWTQVPVRGELVSAWTGGPKTAALSGFSEAELIELARDGFGATLGEAALAREEFVGGATHDWCRDPFARGAYSYIAVGGTEPRSTFAAPIDDTLFFAGEATSSDGQGGTVNGALETGERAAREVAASLGATAGTRDG